MIIIYHSNKLECLQNDLFRLISNSRLHNPFQSEIVLVEHLAMMEWLHIELAKVFTVSAGIRFFLSLDFIWNIVNGSLWNIFPKNIISRSYISWIIMKILSKINNYQSLIADWSYVQKYLHNDVNDRKCLQLSEIIADLFIKYFLYRQDWLIEWEKNNTKSDIQSWQVELWYLFLKEIDNDGIFSYFPYSVYEYIISVLEKDNSNLLQLPKRILIYAVSFFPPILLEILSALGCYIDIYIYSINPCRFFLLKNLNYSIITNVLQMPSDLFQDVLNVSSLNIFYRSNLLEKNKKYYDVDNYLLSVWGMEFQKNIFSLLNFKNVYEQSSFSENIPSFSLLHLLQNDILNDSWSASTQRLNTQLVTHSGLEVVKQRILCSNDCSLSVHVCHNIQREIEVLHDNLLNIISNDQSLSPHDIIVMAPNIDCYISTIQSVFNYASVCGRHLPFIIFNSSIGSINSVISIFLKLLNLPSIRCNVEEIFEFLEIESISSRFNINQDEFKILRTWILESGIRWSLDDDTFSDNVLHSVINVQCTWKFGLTRMLLSYAMDSTHGPWNGILAYDPAGNTIESINLVSRLSTFLEKLKFWRNRLSKVYILEEWLPMVEEIIFDFFVSDFDFETESNLTLLKNSWKTIIKLGMSINYCKTISVNILYNKLLDKLYKKKNRQRIFSGNVIFCNLSSMRSIPFKVIYLLGMNADVYPRNDTPLSFDLMLKNVRYLDYNVWSNDCYLFLEILLAARKSLHISFIGCSMHNHERYRPSILISELFEYIVSNNFYYFKKDLKYVSLLTMEWIYTNLWKWHSRFIFSSENFISNSSNQSFFKEWLPNIEKRHFRVDKKFLCDLSPLCIQNISLDKLSNFYYHPVRAWFQYRLKVYIPKIIEIPLDEPFFIDIHNKYKICHDIICSCLNDEDIDILYRRVRSSAILPYGSFGELCWMKYTKIMIKFSQIIKRYYIRDNRKDIKILLTLKNIQLDGILFSVQKNGLLRWKVGDVSMRDGLLLWLEHLVYCAMGGDGDSYMFGINSFWHFRVLSSIEAKEYLSFLIFGYLHGVNTPLLLFSHSGGCWLQNCFDVKTGKIILDSSKQYKARCKLIKAWEGSQYVYGDSSDPYIRKLIPKLNDEYIEYIISAAKNYFIFPMRFNIK